MHAFVNPHVNKNTKISKAYFFLRRRFGTESYLHLLARTNPESYGKGLSGQPQPSHYM